MLLPTLQRSGNPLADPKLQVETLESGVLDLPSFDAMLAQQGLVPLRATGIEVLQVNVGKVCNQTCRHCHVDAGPLRRESMSEDVASACLRVLERSDIPTLDITGGAPEMNEQFRRLVVEARRLGRRVIDRCNLTILTAAQFEDLPEFLAEHEVEIVASLPCYLEENCDLQRGDGVFRRSIQGLRKLNALGYGLPDSNRTLTLVFNPGGPSLPPPQLQLEEAYRRELHARYGVEFTRLFTITNLPISRFLDDLLQKQQFAEYMQRLVAAFNPDVTSGLMCRHTLSIDWQGRLYDCDFNQMLALGLAPEFPKSVAEIDEESLKQLARRRIVTGRHCFGCTAGSGSSCQGSLSV